MKKYFVILAIFLCGCDLSPTYQPPSLNMPSSWQKTNGQAKPVFAPGWWHEFKDDNLNLLITTALKNNTDILVAYQNIKKAEADLGGSRSFFFPNIGASGALDKGKPDTNHNININSISANLSYEIDLFGKIKNMNRSAFARLQAVTNAADTVKIAIASRVASTYFHLLALQQNLIITTKISKNQQQIYNLLLAQYRVGDLEKLLLDEAKTNLVQTQRQKLDLEKQVAAQKNVLNVLIGKGPQEIIDAEVSIAANFTKIKLPKIINIMPDQLLAQRPDIKAAEQNLKAANYNIGVVKAEYLPDISLNSMLGLSNSRISKESTHGWDANIGFTMPILDFGRIDAKIKVAKANKQIALLQYLQTVRNALKEVLDSMKAVHISAQDYGLVQSSDRAMRNYNNITQTKYRLGKVTQITALEARQKYLAEHLKLIYAKNNQLVAAVEMYQAFGRLN
jgi:multidrug efflux system outer membrane protein